MVLTPAETIDEMLDKIFAAYWLAGVRSTALYDYDVIRRAILALTHFR
jgi:hypothetical protein